jgi:hypothetical protein
MKLFGRRKPRTWGRPLAGNDLIRVADLLMTSWILIAAGAWEGYRDSGRGFVYWDFDDDSMRYIPASVPQFASTSEKRWRDAQRLVKEYNPETEIVIVLNNFVANTLTTIVQPTPEEMPTPPEAFEEMNEDE